MPAASQFGPDGTATVHFMAYGGGNALTLVPQDGSAPQPAVGKPQPQYIQGTYQLVLFVVVGLGFFLNFIMQFLCITLKCFFL